MTRGTGGPLSGVQGRQRRGQGNARGPFHGRVHAHRARAPAAIQDADLRRAAALPRRGTARVPRREDQLLVGRVVGEHVWALAA